MIVDSTWWHATDRWVTAFGVVCGASVGKSFVLYRESTPSEADRLEEVVDHCRTDLRVLYVRVGDKLNRVIAVHSSRHAMSTAAAAIVKAARPLSLTGTLVKKLGVK